MNKSSNSDSFNPIDHYIDPLQTPPSHYSSRIVPSSIFNPEFINQEKKISAKYKTIVFDLDETLRGWDEIHHTTFLRDHLKGLLEGLKKKNYRIVIWTSSTRDSVQQTLNKYPNLEKYIDLIIPLESHCFAFLSDKEKSYLKQIDPPYYNRIKNDTEVEVNPTTGRSRYRAARDINLFGYHLLVDDHPLTLEEAKYFSFPAIRIFTYGYKNPGRQVQLPTGLVQAIENDFQKNMLSRIIDIIEGKKVPEKIYFEEA